MPRPVGRETKLTPELSKKICDVVRAGNYVSVAASYCGVGTVTLHQWIQRGRGEHPDRPATPIYVDFVNDLEAAESGSEVTAVLHWRSAMPKDWHASERWLRTRIPERWGDKEDATARSVAAVQVNISGQSSTQMGGQQGPQRPISSLLEESPHLISNVMQVLDQLLPVDDGGDTDSDWRTDSTGDGSVVVYNPSTGSSQAVFDAENSVWLPSEDESGDSTQA